MGRLIELTQSYRGYYHNYLLSTKDREEYALRVEYLVHSIKTFDLDKNDLKKYGYIRD